MSADAPILYDWSGAPVASGYAPITSRPGQALNSTAQGGILQLGVDASGNARVPRVDAYGTQSVSMTNPAGASSQFYTGQTAPAAASQYGSLMMMRQDLPTPSDFLPGMADPLGSLNVHHKSKMTHRVIVTSVSLAANKSLMSMVNSGSQVFRINECTIYVPPVGSSGNLLGIGSGSTYYPVICELWRITTHTKTSNTSTLTAVSGDTSETCDSGAVFYSYATPGTLVSRFHRQDAIVTTATGLPWYGRGDHNEKTFVVRPGEGFTVQCISNGTVSDGTSTGTKTGSVDIELTITQAAA